MITSVIFPPLITGLSIAPVPFPVIMSSGMELYSDPVLKTCTAIILPLETTGFNCAFFPFFKVISGFLCKFKVFDPYSVPFSYRYAPTISPVTIGVNVKLPVKVDP